MDLYRWAQDEEGVQFFAREPEHIVSLRNLYWERTRREGRLDDPRMPTWCKGHRIDLEDISQVREGEIYLPSRFTGTSPEDADFARARVRLQVANDFFLSVHPQVRDAFLKMRKNLPRKRRQALYKLQTPLLTMGLNFVPEDVMEGIVMCDLTHYMNIAEQR